MTLKPPRNQMSKALVSKEARRMNPSKLLNHRSIATKSRTHKAAKSTQHPVITGLVRIRNFVSWWRTPVLHRPASLALALMLLSISVYAQTDKIDDYVKAELEKRKIPGLSVAVVRNGEVIKAKGYGLANIELNVPATPETVYQSGSVGKQFTATAVMMLVEEGKIGLDDKISKYFADAPERWSGDHRPASAHPHRRDHGLSKGLRLSPRLHRRRTSQEGGRDSARFRARERSGATATWVT